MDAKTTDFVQMLRNRIGEDRKLLANFKTCMGSDSFALSLERSHGAFEAAARLDVFKKVVDALSGKDSKATLKTVKEYALRRVLSRSQSPRHSTSPTVNLVAQEMLAVWAWVFEYTDALVKE